MYCGSRNAKPGSTSVIWKNTKRRPRPRYYKTPTWDGWDGPFTIEDFRPKPYEHRNPTGGFDSGRILRAVCAGCRLTSGWDKASKLSSAQVPAGVV